MVLSDFKHISTDEVIGFPAPHSLRDCHINRRSFGQIQASEVDHAT